MKRFNMKKCDAEGDVKCCTGVVGAVFIVAATILTLLTMNGLGILGMFFVGIMLCRHKMMKCPCCHMHGHCHTEAGGEVVSKPEAKVKPKAKAKPKKDVEKK
tara:strand:- start:29319 stop:29624 length:306 start_codon:yes stop_codon:yes gene_type:complete